MESCRYFGPVVFLGGARSSRISSPSEPGYPGVALSRARMWARGRDSRIGNNFGLLTTTPRARARGRRDGLARAASRARRSGRPSSCRWSSQQRTTEWLRLTSGALVAHKSSGTCSIGASEMPRCPGSLDSWLLWDVASTVAHSFRPSSIASAQIGKLMADQVFAATDDEGSVVALPMSSSRLLEGFGGGTRRKSLGGPGLSHAYRKS